MLGYSMKYLKKSLLLERVTELKDAIYFSKIEYREVTGYGNTSSILLLNIPEQELSYQVFEWKRQMPAIEGIQTEARNGHIWSNDIAIPARRISNERTGFESWIIRDEQFEQKIAFSYAIKLTDGQMKALLPYCNALDFEPYRDRKMQMGEEGYIGYRDEVRLHFRAITDSYIPILELPMDYYYDEEHIWPSEKLYRYLLKTFFEKEKKLRRWGLSYGRKSLFF